MAKGAAALRKAGLASPLSPGIGPPARSADQEVELKLKLRPQDVAALRTRLQRLGRARKEHIDSVYYDTPDQRLAQHKAALRLRVSGKGRARRWVQTVKTQDSEAALSVRGEWERPAPGGHIDLALLADSPLGSLLGRELANLRPVFRTVFVRTAWNLVLGDAQVEAVIDQGEIRAEDRTEIICEAELELRSGAPQVLLDLALRLTGAEGRQRADLSLLPYGISKAARGYRLALGRGPIPFAAGFSMVHRAFTPAMRVGAAARRLVALGMTTMLANAADFSAGGDSEFVHQARVAMRRVRAGLDLLGAGARVPPQLRRSLQLWAGRFGVVRDWDVLCGEHLPPLASAANSGTAAVWQRLCAAAAARRDAARAALERQLQTPAFAEFALRALRWSASAPEQAGKRLASMARKAVRARQRRLTALARSFGQLTIPRQHKARIQAKALRYGIEMLHASLPKRLRRVGLPALERFQDAAGGARDALIVEAVVARLTRSATVRQQVGEWAHKQRAAAIARAQHLAADLKDLQ